MKDAIFNATFEELTSKQRKVLQGFLACETDETIAAMLYVETATVRRHLANICKAFGFSNPDGEHYSYRDELVDLFGQFRPEMVSSNLIRDRGRQLLDIEFPGSPLALDSPFYVERSPIEARCAREILKPGALVRIRAPKRMGKTSLLNRLIANAETAGYRALRLNLRQAEEAVLTNLDTFLRWFCIHISGKLQISPQLDDYWDGDRFGSLVSCTTYFQAHLLGQLDRGLVLGLDEVDWLFEFPKIAQGFFALLRSWHEEANNLEIWQQLRLMVVHSTEVYIPLNLKQSPFNVGLPIRLPELTLQQVQALGRLYGLSFTSGEAEKLTAMVGGHPYRVQLALYHLQSEATMLDDLLQEAATQAGIYGNDLRRDWQTLQDHPDLLAALKTVIAEETTGVQLDPTLAYKLESMGLVQLQGNVVRVSCELYRRYFRDRG